MAGVIEIRVCKTCYENGRISMVPGKVPSKSGSTKLKTYCNCCGELVEWNTSVEFKWTDHIIR
jgi:hypothetical protein